MSRESLGQPAHGLDPFNPTEEWRTSLNAWPRRCRRSHCSSAGSHVGVVASSTGASCRPSYLRGRGIREVYGDGRRRLMARFVGRLPSSSSHWRPGLSYGDFRIGCSQNRVWRLGGLGWCRFAWGDAVHCPSGCTAIPAGTARFLVPGGGCSHVRARRGTSGRRAPARFRPATAAPRRRACSCPRAPARPRRGTGRPADRS